MTYYSIFQSRNHNDSATQHVLYKVIHLLLLPLMVFSLGVMTSCNGDDDDEFSNQGNNLSISDIQGSWIATPATFTAPEFIDILEEGATVTLEIQSNGRFTFTLLMPGEAPEVTTGKLGFDGDFLAVRFDDDIDEASFFISLVNQVLTLRGQTELDLDGNGIDDFGILELIMVRD